MEKKKQEEKVYVDRRPEQVVQDVREKLFSMQDEKYRDFQYKLIPNIDQETVIGVRTPELRAFVKEYAKTEDAEVFLMQLPHRYYDENNLHSSLIAGMKDYDRVIEELDRFLPYVDNWATCDMMSPKVLGKHLPELLNKIKEWLHSELTYTIRFGIEMLMTFYLDKEFKPEYLEMVASLRSEEYYVNMMIAWYFATALAKQYDATLPYFEQHKLDVWTHNKAIQKAIESYRVTDDQKAYLRGMKIAVKR